MIPVRLTPAKRSKYGNVKTDGFDSKHEARVAADLEMQERVGCVRNIRRQVRYPLTVNGALICRYVADFVYDELWLEIGADGKSKSEWIEVIADAKSEPTRKNRAYRIKAKLMAALYAPIREL